MSSAAARKAWRTRHGGKYWQGTWRAQSKRRKRKATAHKPEEFWIGPAVKRPGALRAKVLKRFGRKGFDEKGRIKPSSLNQMLKSADAKTRQQIQFALNVRKLR